MIKNLFYTVLIMGVLALMLFLGLHGPDQGKKVVRVVIEFLHWKPKSELGPLQETAANIVKFNESYKKIQMLWQMTLSRHQQTAKDLEIVDQAIHKNLEELLSWVDTQGVSQHAQWIEEFKRLHQQRRNLVERIIRDEEIMVNLNDQMDQEIRSMTRWMNEQAQSPSRTTMNEKSRVQEYENLQANRKAFNEEARQLDAARSLLLKKSKGFVDALATSNQRLEDHVRVLSSKVETATADQSQGLWREYLRLENEQKELIKNMQANQGSIGENQQKVVSGAAIIYQSISYSPRAQLKKFKENYRNSTESMRNAKERAEDQKRALNDRIRDQMQRIKDDQLNRKLNKN